MFVVKTLNNISPNGISCLPTSLFQIEDQDAQVSPDGVLLRSYNMNDMDLPDSLLAVARAGAGVNNIPVEKCTEEGVVVFNTPGANANAVKELVLAALVMSSRDVASGIKWASTIKGEGDSVPALVEKGKNKFVGPELEGKTLGVIGLGAIGIKVANMATHLHMEVLGYDPFISVDAAWSLSRSVKHSVNLSDVIQNSDYLTLHLPVNAETRGIIGNETIPKMKQGARIINFARGELVDNEALLTALGNGRVASYVTDFPVAELIDQPGVTCIPHLGASTPESEDNCAVMAANQLKDYLINGNIINSVNLPNISVPRSAGSRICVINRNEKGILAGLTGVLNNSGVNIENMTNKSRGDFAYTIIDVQAKISEDDVTQLKALDGVVRVRVI